MDARETIEALGGRQAVADATGSEVSTVVSWEWRGFIPKGKIPELTLLAGRLKGCPVTMQGLLALTEQPAPRIAKRNRATQGAAA
jgi:hypothetical protein